MQLHLCLQAFSKVLTEENPDLFKWLTGQEQPSAEMADNATFMVTLAQNSLSNLDTGKE